MSMGLLLMTRKSHMQPYKHTVPSYQMRGRMSNREGIHLQVPRKTRRATCLPNQVSYHQKKRKSPPCLSNQVHESRHWH